MFTLEFCLVTAGQSYEQAASGALRLWRGVVDALGDLLPVRQPFVGQHAMVQVATSSLARATADFAAKFGDTRKQDLDQIRRIIDEVDGAVGGALGETGLYSVQPPVCSLEELNFGGFERLVRIRVDHLKGHFAADSDSSSLVLDAGLGLGSTSSLKKLSLRCELFDVADESAGSDRAVRARSLFLNHAIQESCCPGRCQFTILRRRRGVSGLERASLRLSALDVGSGKKTFDGSFDCLKKTAGPKGFFSLYAGFGVSLGGIIPYRGFQLGAFDTIVGGNPWKNDTGMVGFASTFAAAQTAIIKGAGNSFTCDTVRMRLQMQADNPVGQHIYKGTPDCLKQIAAEEGVAAGLYKGFNAGALRPNQDVHKTMLVSRSGLGHEGSSLTLNGGSRVSWSDTSILATGTRTSSPESNKWISSMSRLTVHCSY